MYIYTGALRTALRENHVMHARGCLAALALRDAELSNCPIKVLQMAVEDLSMTHNQAVCVFRALWRYEWAPSAGVYNICSICRKLS